MTNIRILLLLLFTLSCNKTVKDKNLYIANIESDERLANIYFNLYITKNNDSTNLIRTSLRALDNGKMNSKHTFLLNNKPFEVVTRKSNYYISNSEYVPNEFTKNQDYLFEVILADSSRHTLAYIKPRDDYQDLNYKIPKHFSFNKNLVIKWENIYLPTNLEIQKEIYEPIFEKKYPNAPHRNTYYKDHEYGHKITDRSGSYTIDKFSLKDSLEVTVGIKAIFEHREKGRLNPNLKNNNCNLTYINRVGKMSVLKEE
ncbi:hypothetical protein KO500_14055 [Cellulophaga baltica]|uniref:hypothetical protein n=1 Tax=Cellulophaga TaxID=104264 RepID=UPI001C06D918|nr:MULTISPECIES: hypothetical protein [Cellulophaga]MBU2997568.1 hypothetical protein [Cellulophaga baltica]MDO6768963.1 hypothetical protein [Cellulophaga sp. 1_MG-2023]